MKKGIIPCLGACLAALNLCPKAPGANSDVASWRPARSPLATRWAGEVNPTNVHPEYPRPQLVRKDWLNLNGPWEFALEPAGNGRPERYRGTILVPFPIESALSGVMQALDENKVIWYRKIVSLPAPWKTHRIRLHCGAVDWHCRVFINGREAGQHKGGFDPFSFDITELLQWQSDEIVIAAADPTESDQPRGKQTRLPEGIFYSPNSGIWQTVWLEPVPLISIDQLQLTPDFDAKGLRCRVAVSSLAEDLIVEAVASSNGVEVAKARGLPNTELFLPTPAARAWSPSDPFLYDLEVRLKEGSTVIDQVGSYFGMRKISLLADERGFARIALNDKVLFQIGVLDQGFWPEGVYTAPTDEALKSDILFLKRAGFNLARKHVKVEPERWYYWCDRLGMLVWQDMPSGKNATADSRKVFENELLRMLRALHNHPSIVVWVLFNEGWGQYDTERLTRWVKRVDPSRLIDNASGWTDTRVGDLVDVHSYPGPDAPEAEARRAAVLGEFGGLGLPIEGHSWPSNRWGYKNMENAPALGAGYQHLLEKVWTLHDQRGLSAAIYTQLTDVESECNGLLTYDRAMAKVDLEIIARANAALQQTPRSRIRQVVEHALQGPVLWKYTLKPPEGDWFAPKYDDSPWSKGVSGFGTPGTPGAKIGTLWNTGDIWMRREFVLPEHETGPLKLEVHHDEDAEIYLNGVLAARLSGFISAYEIVDMLPESARTLSGGTNLLAVHCHQTGGGQFIDVGLVSQQIVTQPPARSK